MTPRRSRSWPKAGCGPRSASSSARWTAASPTTTPCTCAQLPDHIDWLEAAIASLDDRIVELCRPWAQLIEWPQTIPEVGQRTAEPVVAETGADMSAFPTSGHLASWVGLCPGHNESGGKRRSGKTRKGNAWLAQALTEAAWSAAHTKNTYLAARFRRVAGPRPDDKRKKKAAIAVAHKILIAAYHVMATGQCHQDLGGNYYTQREDPERRKDRLIRQLQQLGYQVDLTPIA